MVKLLFTQYRYKLFPKKHVICSCCHRDFVSEPFVMYIQFYSGQIGKESNRCWRCVRSREACELIMQKWPRIFYMVRKGQFYYLEHNRWMTGFLDGGSE